MMKKLMIVGASVLQLPAILKAKEMGLHVAVVDYNPQAIGMNFTMLQRWTKRLFVKLQSCINRMEL